MQQNDTPVFSSAGLKHDIYQKNNHPIQPLYSDFVLNYIPSTFINYLNLLVFAFASKCRIFSREAATFNFQEFGLTMPMIESTTLKRKHYKEPTEDVIENSKVNNSKNKSVSC